MSSSVPARSLRIGWREDRSYEWPRIPDESYRADGRYASALDLVKRLLSSPTMDRAYAICWERAVASGSTLPAATFEEARLRFMRQIPWLLVLEAETARLWSEGPKDWRSAMRDYEAGAKKDAQRIKSAIQDLRRFDARHAYLLRHAFWYAANDFLSDKKRKRARRPDQNKDKGYETIEVAGPKVREHEFQFISRLSFFRFAELLQRWETKIDELSETSDANWLEYGALRFKSTVTPREAVKLRIVHLGLIAHLMSRLRDFTAGYGVRVYWTGQAIPTHGKPCWDIVAEFLNCATSPDEPQTGDTVRRAWQSFTKKHPVTLQAWPKPAVAESQTD